MSPADYIAERVDIDPTSGCWVWVLARDSRGYGKAKYLKRTWRAHRLSYLAATGEEPEVVHHVCENKVCCNPDHLAPTTYVEHSRDIHQSWHYNAEKSPKKPTCRTGHSREQYGYTNSNGTWGCRACLKVYQDRYYRKKQNV